MNNAIVTTTIQPPTEATLKFCKLSNWDLIIVGDLKTPKNDYKNINCKYITTEEQESLNKELSDSIGWNTIQRRNLGFLFAYKEGYEIIASVDDDNIPKSTWGENLYINKEIEVTTYDTPLQVFDPLSVTERNDLWHRGYPIQLLKNKNDVVDIGKKKKKVLIQADLWDGDPDIDAICRLSKMPMVEYKITEPYSSTKLSPFNSQNTFFHRSVVPFYMVIPHVGRMDDIWGGYLLQQKFNDSLIYNKASVFQDRNEQDLITNLEWEIIGYRNTLDFINGNYKLPEKASRAYSAYLKAF
ncbi:MAG: hypothetical protein CBD44_01100 [Flavobacteriaceae bacterium TMED184]|nr:MAG: hypothetical protein CBD44_01100 [Flavobacteriaceae bacterium TMED184]